MSNAVWGLLTLIVWSVSTPWALAQSVEELAQEPFRGLQGVGVSVDAVKPQSQQAGLIASEVHAQVERRLREAGIRVLTRDEALETPGMPYLYVYVDTTQTEAGLYAYVVRVSLNQGVALDRNAAIKIHTETWNSGSVGTVAANKLQQVSKTINAKVDEFIATYRGANLAAGATPRPSPAVEQTSPEPQEFAPILEPVETSESPQRQEQEEPQDSVEEQESPQIEETGEGLEAAPTVEEVETQQVTDTEEEVQADDGSPKETRRGVPSSGPRAGNPPRSGRPR